MGSMDVAVVAVAVAPRMAPRTRTPSPPPLPVYEDLTERGPEVAEFLAEEEDEPPLLLIAAPLADAEGPQVPASEEDESPALVIGVHVPDSEDVAEQVSDEDLETRPLPFLAPPMPYAGVPVQPTDVRELLRGFQVADGISEAELRRELKALAGLDLTPGSAVEVIPR